jgi:hypothetical protein
MGVLVIRGTRDRAGHDLTPNLPGAGIATRMSVGA